MTTPFYVYGPLELKIGRIAEKEYQNGRWELADSHHPMLSEAKGIYLFSLRNKSNYKPVYVGITDKQNFRREVFNTGNLAKLLHGLRGQKGTLCLHFLAKPKNAHKGISKNVPKKALTWVEVFVLFACRQKNPKMLNKSHATFLRTVEIDKVTRSRGKGNHNSAVRTFRNALAF